MLNLFEQVSRLPLCPMKPENRGELEKAMSALGLLQPQEV
jgi:hypothetical protein